MIEEKTSTEKENKDYIAKQIRLQAENAKIIVWDREKISILIDRYKKHECLWNNRHEWYKNKEKRNRAMEEICTLLDIPKYEFAKKIHNLRNQFNNEMKKWEQRMEEADVSIDEPEAKKLRCSWIYFDSLMFLRNVIESRPSNRIVFLPAQKFSSLNSDPLEDDVSDTTDLRNSSNSKDSTQYDCDDDITEEVITDDYQLIENEEVGESNYREEISDQKYQSPQQVNSNRELPSSSHNFKKAFSKQKKTSLRSTPQTEAINHSNELSIRECNSNNINVVPRHKIMQMTSSSSSHLTTPVISAVASNSSTGPTSGLRDQWDAFGELVANEFRNLNSEVSRKHLKRKIMHAMVEVGEDDDLSSSNCVNN